MVNVVIQAMVENVKEGSAVTPTSSTAWCHIPVLQWGVSILIPDLLQSVAISRMGQPLISHNLLY